VESTNGGKNRVKIAAKGGLSGGCEEKLFLSSDHGPRGRKTKRDSRKKDAGIHFEATKRGGGGLWENRNSRHRRNLGKNLGWRAIS